MRIRRLLVGICIVLLGSFTGCKRYNWDYAAIKKPKDTPPYQLQLDPHSTSNRSAPAGTAK